MSLLLSKTFLTLIHRELQCALTTVCLQNNESESARCL